MLLNWSKIRFSAKIPNNQFTPRNFQATNYSPKFNTTTLNHFSTKWTYCCTTFSLEARRQRHSKRSHFFVNFLTPKHCSFEIHSFVSVNSNSALRDEERNRWNDSENTTKNWNASKVASFLQNLQKIIVFSQKHFRPDWAICKKVSFSKDFGPRLSTDIGQRTLSFQNTVKTALLQSLTKVLIFVILVQIVLLLLTKKNPKFPRSSLL